MKIKTEFTSKNLTIFGGYSNIFSFFVKSHVFENLDRLISIDKRKKMYEKLDYIKILLTMLTCGFSNMNQLSLFNGDSFMLRLLGVPKMPHASNVARFLKKFTFKHTQQIIDVKRELFKKFHPRAFTLQRLTIDIDTTVINLCGRQEGAEKGYNDVKRGNRSYQVLLAFIYETKELFHGILKPGNVYCSNGAVEFIKELKSMLPYGIRDITLRADSARLSLSQAGFFSNGLFNYLENGKFRLYHIRSELCNDYA